MKQSKHMKSGRNLQDFSMFLVFVFLRLLNFPTIMFSNSKAWPICALVCFHDCFTLLGVESELILTFTWLVLFADHPISIIKHISQHQGTLAF